LTATTVVRRALSVVATGVVVAAVAAACSSGSGNGESKNANALPPNDKAAIERVFAAKLERLGVRLTRGALVDRRTGKPSATGTHLAVYVEPTGGFTPDDYARGTVSTLRVFIPSAFERWGGLDSFDVCQEPLPALDTRPEPPPETKVDLTKEASRKVRWGELDLARLLNDAKRLGPRALSVYAKPDVRNTAVYQRAAVKANTSATPGTTATTVPPPSTPSYTR
jgi:hypothetical protein